MNKSPTPQAPLVGDSARQAIDSLRGYDYQIWRSVEAWMLLQLGETLFLECAEDYDIVSEVGGVSVQVKSSPKDISLGMQEIRDAIQNFWKLQKRNLTRGQLSLKFLTRGAVRFEKGKPFTPHKGIDFWRIAADGDDSAAVRIARFLSGKFSETDLNTFLKTASAKEIREKIIGRVEWVTGEPGFEAIEIHVQRLAVALGNERNLPASVSLAAIDGLLEHCRLVARKSKPELRCLAREDLQIAFERKTSVLVPMTHQSLVVFSQALIASQLQGQRIAGLTLAPAFNGFEPPPLPIPTLPRPKLVQHITSSLVKGMPVLIAGTEGRGKTTVANLVSRKLQLGTLWVDTSGLDGPAVATAIERVLAEVRSSSKKNAIVLDDLPVSEGMPQIVWSRLAALLVECKASRHMLLFTAKGINEDAIDSRFRSSSVDVVPVPDLSRQEVEDFFALLDCEPGAKRKNLAILTLAQSVGGHPKLVHLRALELKELGWPEPSAKDLITAPKSIGEAQTSARHAAARSLSAQELELLYLMSLTSLPFDRSVALNLGTTIPGISAPGDAFDRMVGRWIENIGPIGFKTTSLLIGQASLAWEQSKVREGHAKLFDAFLLRKHVRADEAFSLLVHALLSQDHNRLASFISSLLTADEKVIPSLFEGLKPVVYMGRSSHVPAVPFDQHCSVMFKVLQFRVAIKEEENELAKIAAEWEWEISLLPEGPLRDGSVLLRALSILAAEDGNFEPDMLVHALLDTAKLRSMIDKMGFASGLPSDLLGPNSNGSTVDIVTALFVFIHARCHDVDFFDKLLDALDSADEAARTKMLDVSKIDMFQDYSLLVDRAWISETRKPDPNWSRVITVLRKTIDRASGPWASPDWAIGATKALSIILDEYDEQKEEALKILEVGQKAYPTSLVLIEQEANIWFRRGEYKKALDRWHLSLMLDSNDTSKKVKDPFAFRKAGIAAGKLGRFGEAADWFEKGALFAKRLSLQSFHAGFLFDAAYAWFRHRDWRRVVGSMFQALLEVKDNFVPETEFEMFATKKLGGSSLLWMLSQLKISHVGSQAEPWLGMCSNPEKEQGIKALPPTPYPSAAVILLQVAFYLQVQMQDLEILEQVVKETKVPLFSIQYWTLKLDQTMANCRFKEMAEIMLRLQEVYWKGIAQRRLGENPLMAFTGISEEDDGSFSNTSDSIFMVAVLLQGLSGKSLSELFASWESTFAQNENGKALCMAISRVRDAVSIDAKTARTIVQARGTVGTEKLGAAVRLLFEPTRAPVETTLMQVTILTWLFQSVAKFQLEECIDLFANLFTAQWRPHLVEPALLYQPRLTIPQLASALDLQDVGARRLKLLFEAGSIATGIRLPGDLLESLKQLAQVQDRRIAV